VAVGKDVGLDNDFLADSALDGKRAAVDLRRHSFDHDTVAAILGIHPKLSV
jgi:hypothetical protein